MVSIRAATVAVLCAGFSSLANAVANPAASAATSTISQPGCPSAISIQNGGFESGQLAPWERSTVFSPNAALQFVSPGYKSKHAFSVTLPASNFTEWELTQTTTGKECYGYYYKLSYAWNWAKYTGPEGKGPAFCRLEVLTGYTDHEGVYHYATRTPGWHHASVVVRDVYSHCKPLAAEYVVNVVCSGGDDESEVLPGFTILLDDFKIENAAGPANPPSPPNC